MRRSVTMRHYLSAVVCVGALTLGSGVGAAYADNPHGPKVDDRVAFAADVSAPTAAIPVTVFGTAVGGRKNPELSVKSQLYPQVTAGSVSAGQLDQLAGDSNVVFIAPDVAVAPLGNASAQPSGLSGLTFPALATLYPVADNAPAAWAQGYTGAGQGIAVIDSGATRDDLGPRLRESAGANHGDDVYGHGMLVSHIAAGCSAGGSYVGIAPGADVVSYNVNSGAGANTSDVIAGLIWVLANQSRYNIKVVNISLGETSPSSATQSLLDSVIDVMQQSYGILVVTSAGNLGPDSMFFPPANDPSAMSVGATDTMGTAASGDDTLTPWSSYGTTVDGYAKPEIVAPGRRITSYLSPDTVLGGLAPADSWSATRNYASISGTSFSAPQVAGAAAVLFQANPTWTPGQVKWVLANTARPVAGSSARSLDLGAALAYRGTPPDANAGLVPSTFGTADWVAGLLQGNRAGWKSTAVAPTSVAPTQSTWTQSTWTQATWTQATWTQATWTQATWTQATWTNVVGS
jgi:serine protease AprX